jgi:hypothetical protein
MSETVLSAPGREQRREEGRIALRTWFIWA